MEHYVIVIDWANEYENGSAILGVTHSLEDAKEIFNAHLTAEKRYAKEHGLMIYDDDDVSFDAGKEGYYVTNHTRLYIQGI